MIIRQERQGLEALQPSVLPLHGLTFWHVLEPHKNTRRSYEKFRDFIGAMVPEVEDDRRAGRVAKHLLRLQYYGVNSFGRSIFEEDTTDAIRFKGTLNSRLDESQLLVAAGNGKVGETVLHLFEALADTELAATTFADNNYCLEPTCSGWVQSPELTDQQQADYS